MNFIIFVFTLVIASIHGSFAFTHGLSVHRQKKTTSIVYDTQENNFVAERNDSVQPDDRCKQINLFQHGIFHEKSLSSNMKCVNINTLPPKRPKQIKINLSVNVHMFYVPKVMFQSSCFVLNIFPICFGDL